MAETQARKTVHILNPMADLRIQLWSNYWGCLKRDLIDPAFESCLYGFQNPDPKEVRDFQISNEGTQFGFVSQGEVTLYNRKIRWSLQEGQWFSIPAGMSGTLRPRSALVAITRLNYQGLYSMGGPVETLGRLKYIDGCSDTLLCCPPLLGDPCLNLLHFPKHVRQTAHSHPSSRMGIVIDGEGICESTEGQVPLKRGDIFFIPPYAVHRFATSDKTLNVMAYHPDSDWGPIHENHPMINRTWVNGEKIANV